MKRYFFKQNKKTDEKKPKTYQKKIRISVGIVLFLVGSYYGLKSHMNVDNLGQETVISIDVALIALVIATVGISITGYIFLNGYYASIEKEDKSLKGILAELNRKYVRKVFFSSIASAISLCTAFAVIFFMKENSGDKILEEKSDKSYIIREEKNVTSSEILALQDIVYISTIGVVLYNLHFMCQIIKPNKLIRKMSEEVVLDTKFDIEKSLREKEDEPAESSLWKDFIDRASGDEKTAEYCLLSQRGDSDLKSLVLIRNIYCMESIINRCIELNAIKGRARNRKEALEFIFGDAAVSTMKYKRRNDNIPFPRKNADYAEISKKMIGQYVQDFEILVNLRNALIHMDEKKYKLEINQTLSMEVSRFAAMMLRVTLDRFSNFVKITNLELGGSNMRGAIFSWSDISFGDFTGADLSYTKMQHTVLRECDLSNVKLDFAEMCEADLYKANLSYASMVDVDLSSANLSEAKLVDIVFLNSEAVKKGEMINGKYLRKDLEKKKREFKSKIEENISQLELYATIRECVKAVNDNIQASKTKLDMATVENVLLKGVCLNGISLNAVSFENSILSNALFLGIKHAEGLRAINCNLKGVHFVCVEIPMSDFSTSNMANACLWNANMKQSSFRRCNLVQAIIAGSDCGVTIQQNCRNKIYCFCHKKFVAKDFSIEVIQREGNTWSNWLQTNLDEINAIESIWINTLLNEASLRNASLKNAVMYNIALNWSSMEKCDMTYSKFVHVSFRMAKLTDAIFTRANLKKAIFYGTNLMGAIFVHAKLEDVYFEDCNLWKVNFANTLVIRATFKSCNIEGAYFQDTTFVKCAIDKTLKECLENASCVLKECTYI